MQSNVLVRCQRRVPLVEFLQEKDFQVEAVQDDLYKISQVDMIDVYLSVKGGTLYFEMEVGRMDDIADEGLYRKLLDLNTEILPVSIGLDTTSSDESRLVIIESREALALDENELLTVFEAFEIACAKVEVLLSDYLKS